MGELMIIVPAVLLHDVCPIVTTGVGGIWEGGFITNVVPGEVQPKLFFAVAV